MVECKPLLNGEVLVTTPALSTMPPPAVPVVIAPPAPFLSPPVWR